MDAHTWQVLISLLVAIAALIVMVSRLRFPPFVALLVASLLLALLLQQPLTAALEHFHDGFAALMRSTALIIAFGAILGKLLADSGGADVIAEAISRNSGRWSTGWTMWFAGCLIGAGVWFTVGLVLLAPLAITVSRMRRTNLLLAATGVLAGLSAMHGLVPPHPGPLAAAETLGASVGKVVGLGLLIAAASAAVAGPMFWSMFRNRLQLALPDDPAPDGSGKATTPASRPTLAVALSVLLAPVALITLPTLLGLVPVSLGVVGEVIEFLGEPTIAMLVCLGLAACLLSSQSGDQFELRTSMERSLYPVAMVLLVVGAGAGFSRVLIESGCKEVFIGLARNASLSPLVMGWLFAAAVRVATGSATTAITAAAAPAKALLAASPGTSPELMVMALGAGSLTLSHVNDGGFWFAKEYFGMSVRDTFKTWTVLETVLSLVVLVIVLGLDMVL